MYWKVRLESICGSGPEAGEVVSAAGVEADSLAGALTGALSAGADDVPLQATLPSRNISKGRRNLNHGAHGGTRGKPVRGLVVVPDVWSGLIVSPWPSALPVVTNSSCPNVSYAAWDGPATRWRCLRHKVRSWAPRKRTYSGCR